MSRLICVANLLEMDRKKNFFFNSMDFNLLQTKMKNIPMINIKTKVFL